MSSAARFSSCTSPAGTKRSARAALVSLALLAIAAMPTFAAEQIDMDAEVRDLKADVLDLNRELFLLEEELLFPANTQVAVYLSMDTGNFFELDSVQVTIDDRDVAKYLYTEREVDALHRVGVHRVFMGNLKAGDHEMVAVFTGRGPHGRDYRRATALSFEKGLGARFLELVISDSDANLQPDFRVQEWNGD